MSAELLPCPFCGNGKNIAMANEKHDHSGGYFIACPVCDASTGLRYAMGDDPTPLLIEQWNRRATHPKAPEAQTNDAELLAELRLAREYVWRAFNKDSSTLKGVAQQRAAGHRLDQIDRAIAKAAGQQGGAA